VFLSYARADRARAAKLAEALNAACISVWWDTAIETGSRLSANTDGARLPPDRISNLPATPA